MNATLYNVVTAKISFKVNWALEKEEFFLAKNNNGRDSGVRLICVYV